MDTTPRHSDSVETLLKKILTALDGGPSGGSATLSGLTDVTITDPVTGQSLTYDSISGKWVNSTPTTGGGADLQEVWMNTGI